MCFYLEHNKKLHFKCLCLTWPTTRDNINTKFLTGPCPTNPRPSPPMLMGSAVGAADKMKDENALQHWRGARAAKIEVRGDAKDLVLISSRLVVKLFSLMLSFQGPFKNLSPYLK